jgi:hypothetical protein
LRTLGFVKINDIPFLGFGSVVTMYLNWASFSIITTFNIKHFTVVPVDELVTLILEDLPPSRVSAPDLHVVGSTRRFDIE